MKQIMKQNKTSTLYFIFKFSIVFFLLAFAMSCRNGNSNNNGADGNGNNNGNNNRSSDTTAPRLLSSTAEVSYTLDRVTIRFTEAIRLVNMAGITITNTNNNRLSINSIAVQNISNIVINVSLPLVFENYTVSIAAGSIQDMAGNPVVAANAMFSVNIEKILAQDGAINDSFGISVAIDGNTAIVGSYFDDIGSNNDQGSAYIFIRQGNRWSQQAQLTALDGEAEDQFGRSVDIDGDTAIIGAHLEDAATTNNNRGSAYIFTRIGTTWTQQAKLNASDRQTQDRFGISVAIDGNTSIVGSWFDNVGGNSFQGSAYIFTRTGTTWTQQQKINASDGQAMDYFGISVAISGETVIVGSYLDDIVSNVDNRGSAYIFTRSGGMWTHQQKLNASDGAQDDRFGISVAIDGNTAIVGASRDDIGSNTDQGSAYIFTRSGVMWTQQQKLSASFDDGQAGDRFGYSVGIDGNTAIIGARQDNIRSNTNQGSAYLFRLRGGSWIQQGIPLIAIDGAAEDQFGRSVAIDGNTVIVGSYQDNIGSNSNQGSAYFFSSSVVEEIIQE